jgi:hypothetical protein
VFRYVTNIKYVPIGVLRQSLRDLQFPVERILNIAYVSRSIAEFIMHPAMLREFEELVFNAKWTILTDYDPASPRAIRDPAWKERTLSERTQLARRIFCRRLHDIGSRMRSARCREWLEEIAAKNAPSPDAREESRPADTLNATTPDSTTRGQETSSAIPDSPPSEHGEAAASTRDHPGSPCDWTTE